jgi:hypothetical protein
MTSTKKSASNSKFDVARALKLMQTIWDVAFNDKYLDQAKQRFERDDDKSALADALYFCVLTHSTLPEWVEQGFGLGYARLRISFDYCSWDEVLGPPHRKHAHVDQRRAEYAKRAKVWVMVTKLRRKHKHRDAFGPVAKQLDISVGLARKYFYAMDEQIRQIPPGGLELLKVLGTLREAAEASTNFPK